MSMSQIFSCDIESEDKLVSELILLCDKNGAEKEENLRETAKSLHQLGRVYANKAILISDTNNGSSQKVSLIQSAVLLNAALCRYELSHPQEDFGYDGIQADLRTLCDHVLKLAGSTSQVDMLELSRSVVGDIKKMREIIKNELMTVEKIPDDVFGEELHDLEEKKVEDLSRIQEHVTEMYIKVMCEVGSLCIKTLKTPPCKFAVVGMGSLARKEITPYSDFENIILVPNKVENSNAVLEYFRWFAVVFQLILVNLRETIIPSVCVPSLNDAHSLRFSKKNWFFDQFTVRGISFDGLMPHACKCPLGRFYKTEKCDFTTELIKSVDDMVEYLDSDEDLRNGYHLADLLTKTCFVYGNKEVYQEFDDLSKRKLNEQRQFGGRFLQQLYDQVDEDKKSFETWKNLSNFHKNLSSDVKKNVYRVSTIFISALGKFYGVEGSSCFDIIKALQDINVLSNEDAHQLMYAVAIACEVRLRWYMKRESQTDKMPKSISITGYDTLLFDLIGEKSTLEYFDIVHSLHAALPNFLDQRSERLVLRKVPFTKPAIYFFLHKYQKSIDGFRAELLNSANDNDMKVYVKFRIGYALFYLEKYQEAIVEFEDSLDLLNQMPCSENNRKVIKKNHIALADCYRCIKKYHKALECYLKAPIDSRDDIELNNRGVVYLKLGEYGQARKFFEEAISILESKNQLDKASLALLIHNVGRCFYEEGNFEKALEELQKSYDLRLLVRTDDGPDQNTAGTLYNIGRCFLGLRDFDQATRNIEASLEMLKLLPAGISTDLSIADNLHYLGRCKFELLDYEGALALFRQEYELRSRVQERQEMNTKDDMDDCSRFMESCLSHLQ